VSRGSSRIVPRAALTASGGGGRLEALAISYNGGKDCNVLVHLLAAVLRRLSSPASSSSSLPRLPALYVACAAPFAEVERFVAASVARYNLELRRVRSDMKGGLQEYMRMRAEHMGRPCSTVFVGQRRTDPGGGELGALGYAQAGGLALDGLTLAFPLAQPRSSQGIPPIPPGRRWSASTPSSTGRTPTCGPFCAVPSLATRRCG
jgi:hypothetical protein